MDGPSPVLTAERVALRLPDQRTLVHDLSFQLAPGELLAVDGPNGAGKTSLLLAVLGRWPGVDGRLQRHVAAHAVSYLPQLENRSVHGPLTLGDALGNVPRSGTRYGALLGDIDLARRWNDASGGERKRTLLYRLLARRPALCLLDEPMNHLDSGSRVFVRRALQDYLEDGGAAVLVSHEGGEHDSDVFGLRRKVVRLRGHA